jgi:hypothetical protein
VCPPREDAQSFGMGCSSWPPHAGFLAAKHFCNLHRSKIPNLDPYITLAWQRLQAAVTMAMQVGPTVAHIPPGPERIVAQDEVHAIDTHLGIWLYAFPTIAAIDRSIVIVPHDKVFAAMQRLDQRCHALWPLANGEVAQVPDLIIRSNHRIPPINHLAIHLGNGCKRTAIKAECPRMAKG